ncbi:MAG: 6-phosphogluconolactonase [Pseudomonadales bacterium]|nr:6-phosphogluconolactonase [Pseudomonadales bacterium]
MLNEHFFATRDELFLHLQYAIERQLKQALAHRDIVSILVSGGKTPAALYQNLSKSNLDWSSIYIALVDERWVAETDRASNAGFIRHTLFQNRADQARFVTMKNSAVSANAGWKACEAAYQKIPAPFELCLLGMGIDGHTASLFPEAKGLSSALSTSSLCAGIVAKPSVVTGEYTERMSLTLNGILQCRQIYLLITGEEKRHVYQQALLHENVNTLPISAVLQQESVPVNIYWAE